MDKQLLPHILVEGFVQSKDFKSPLSVQREAVPQRDRISHGQGLLTKVTAMEVHERQLNLQRATLSLPTQSGLTIAVDISPKNAIDYKTFEWKKDGLELLTVSEGSTVDTVTLFVPDGKLTALASRIQDYLTKNARDSQKPKNASLVNAIQDIRRAAFDQLWTDVGPMPETEATWCQVWLRKSNAKATLVHEKFSRLAGKLGIEVEPGFVIFPGRVVVAARGTRSMFEGALQLLDLVAEIRSVQPTAEFFLSDLSPEEQSNWVSDLASRTIVNVSESSPFVTLLDTGVNNGHPLLRPGLHTSDLHAVDVAWGTDDAHGHGTGMAGLALYGNLTGPLSSGQPVSIHHALESVKILPPTGENPIHLYGAVTRIATSRVEIGVPHRNRVFAMMTTSIGDITGAPSEWSATVDQLAFGRTPLEIGVREGDDDETEVRKQRLFVLAAGNVPWHEWTGYPGINAMRTIENPAQAWNAITVGAMTHLIDFDQSAYPNYAPIANAGALSPSSRTSVSWITMWPYKPDVVAEGGNGCLEHAQHVSVGPESLRLLTTSHEPVDGPLVESGDTSAATAEVARLCARVRYAYPAYWPETVRALVIHGARYTQAMRGLLPVNARKLDKINLIRKFGYGLINAENSELSELRRPTMIIEREFFPYRLDKSSVKLGQMQLHDLPWPKEELLKIDGEVAMRVTLSYFVEPNPARRGWQSKFRYQSFALRFAVRGATESEEMFLQRVNKLEREDDDVGSHSDPDSANWTMGAQLRVRGSIHSDVWVGTTAQLAMKSQIAVIPVGGWWKDWKEAEQFGTSGRYALVVSLEVADSVATPVDLYTPIATKVGITIPPIQIDI
ncbi:S8 family serine peptidase [Duganella sp. FT134W]|uniref:S8 family serine peptidase n=1 Tax=Duganella margarita TaxID=2692170 RepID=A0A7X4KFS6_9BURK|nr:S8 family peptidase [Duganella margarita]MYM71650.1 S8 family serine peptidase [Duganella margarita]